MKRGLSFAVAVGGALAFVLSVGVAPGFGQVPASRPLDHEICRPFIEGCLPIKAASGLPAAPAHWKMPRTPDGKPDFTGVFAGPGFTQQVGDGDTDTPLIRGFDSKRMSPMAPGGDKILFRPVTGQMRIDDPIGLCLPFGFTGQILSPYAQQWVQSPKYIVNRHEFMDNWSRIVPLDGRPHPKDAEPTYGGNSVGHWEGDTLVIDTVGLKEWWLDVPHPRGSLWHSDAMHVIERLKWIAPQLVSYEITMDDPKIWTKPWTEQLYMVLHPTWDLLEYVCLENDRCAGEHCVPSDAQKK